MCGIGVGLRSGKIAAILYSDGTAVSKLMQDWLDAAGANYAVQDSSVESLDGPVLVVNGIFLGPDDVKDVLGIR